MTIVSNLRSAGSVVASTPLGQARQIMGPNYFGPSEAETCFRINSTHAPEVPFSQQMLHDCAQSYVLVLVYPVPIYDLARECESLFYLNKYSRCWQLLSTENLAEPRWHLIRKNSVPGSVEKSWDKQQALLEPGELIPTAQVMVYTIIGHYRARQERLFANEKVRTSSSGDIGPICVGQFSPLGLVMSDSSATAARSNIGICAAVT